MEKIAHSLQDLSMCIRGLWYMRVCRHVLLTQVMILRWEEAGAEHLQELYDIQPHGSGRLNWAAVKKAFGRAATKKM